MEKMTTVGTEKSKPNKLSEEQKETLMLAIEKVTESIDTKIGNLQYLISKTATHPEQMTDVDFAAVNTAQEMVHFLNTCKTLKK